MDCSFCEKKIPKGTEFVYVTTKGKAHYLCSSKCYKNMVVLKRKARTVKWTKAYRIEKEARLKLIESRKKPKVEAEPKSPKGAKAEPKSKSPKGETKAKAKPVKDAKKKAEAKPKKEAKAEAKTKTKAKAKK